MAFGLPSLFDAGSTPTVLTIPIIFFTIGFYAFFFYRQTGARREAFSDGAPAPEAEVNVLKAIATLIACVVPIVLLSHNMAGILDGLGTPVAWSGVLIAMIVFLPESVTTIRSAQMGQGQRVLNLCHGALVSTVGLTVPVVLIIGLVTDQTVFFGESPMNLALLVVTMLMSAVTFSSRKATPVHGVAHLAIFAVFLAVLGHLV